MIRREFLALCASLALVLPLAATAQQQPERVRVVGVLIGLAEDDPNTASRLAGFQQGLHDLGWFEGRNIRLHYRSAGTPERIQVLAQELISLQPDVLVASGTPVVLAFLRETRTTPIVFVTASDPIGDGFVASMARPGGTATGFTNNASSMGGKWLDLLKEIAPATSRVAVLFNPDTAPNGGSFFLRPLETAAASVGVTPLATAVRSPAEIEQALVTLAREPGAGLVATPDVFTVLHRKRIVTLAANHRIPAVYPFRYFATDGGLLSYGADLVDLYRRAPSYVDRILKGARPADLPVQSATKVEMVINLKAAQALGLSVSRILLARADEVIE